MGFFVKKIAVYSCLFASILVLISFIKISYDYTISETYHTSYEKVAWNLNSIRNKPEMLDSAILFFGDSRTQGNVNDSILCHNGIKSVNMGVNHRGPELEWFFAKEARSVSAPCMCVFTNTLPSGGIHNMSPLVIPSTDILQALNYRVSLTWFINYLPNRVAFVLSDLTSRITKNEGEIITTFSNYGHRPEENTSMKAQALMNQPLLDVFEGSEKTDVAHQMWRNLIKRFYFFTIQTAKLRSKSEGLCERNLYITMPAFRAIPMCDAYQPYENKLNEICNNPTFWYDRNHLNQIGSEKFTKEIILPIIKTTSDLKCEKKKNTLVSLETK